MMKPSNTHPDRELLLRAAAVMAREAELIRRAHVLAQGTWPDQYRDAKRHYDEYTALAAALQAAADSDSRPSLATPSLLEQV